MTPPSSPSSKAKQCDRVVFRRYKDGQIIALFPNQPEGRGRVNSYMFVGEHGGADYAGVVRDTKPAKPSEYKRLFAYLKQRGYNPCASQRARPAAALAGARSAPAARKGWQTALYERLPDGRAGRHTFDILGPFSTKKDAIIAKKNSRGDRRFVPVVERERSRI